MLLLLLVLLLLEQLFGQGVVELSLTVIRIESHSVTVALQSLLKALLHKEGITQIISDIGTLNICACRVLSQLAQGLFRLVDKLLAELDIGCIELSLKAVRVVLQCARVVIYASVEVATRVLTVSLADKASLGHTLCVGIVTK